MTAPVYVAGSCGEEMSGWSVAVTHADGAMSISYSEGVSAQSVAIDADRLVAQGHVTGVYVMPGRGMFDAWCQHKWREQRLARERGWTDSSNNPIRYPVIQDESPDHAVGAVDCGCGWHPSCVMES